MTICGNFLEMELDKEEVEIKSWEDFFEKKLCRKKSVRVNITDEYDYETLCGSKFYIPRYFKYF